MLVYERVYAREGIQLYHGKCEHVLPDISVCDAVVADLPYGIGEAAGKNKSRGQLAPSRDYGDLDWDDQVLSPEVLQLILEHGRWQILFGGNFYRLPPTSCWLVWDKVNGTNDFADCELAWTNLPKAVRKLSFMWNGFLRDSKDIRVHPTQKPVDVMRWCISHLPADVETICDPCCGSASTGIACVRSGKKFVGIEQHKPYLDAAISRFEAEFARESLFQATERQAELFS